MLTPEQAEHVKQGLKEHIDSTFPEDRKDFAKAQVEAMSSDELEQFLLKNNLLNAGGELGKEECVFCSIVSGKINAYKVFENKEAMATLEINPMSQGHIIIIPREHVKSKKEMPKEARRLAKEMSKLLRKKLNPKEVRQENSNFFGHEIINVIPIYGGFTGARQRAAPEELRHMQETLTKVEEKISKKGRTSKKPKDFGGIIRAFEEKMWLPKRIP